MKKARLAVASGAIVGAYLVVAIGTQIYVRSRALPRIDADQTKLERYESRILADFKLLTEKPVFQVGPRETNAERFLTGFIAWSDREELQTPEHARLVESRNEHLDTLNSDENWKSFVDDEAIYDFDLAWVDQLLAYDHIDIATHPRFTEDLARVEDVTGVARIGIASEMPFPHFEELRFAALVRAAQLAREHRAQEALELYRHVGRLMWTSDTLVGAMTSFTMLKNEKKLAEKFSVAWTSVDDERIDAMKRTTWAWPGLMRLRATTGSLGSIEPYFTREANACSWVHETSSGTELILGDYLQPTIVFEPNLNERLERERGLFLKALAACDHSELKAFYAPVKSPLMIGRGVPNPARIPFVRRYIGLTLVEIATPNFFRFYETSSREPASN